LPYWHSTCGNVQNFCHQRRSLRALMGPLRMHSPTILCDAHTPEGSCGSVVRIRQAHYEYRPRPWNTADGIQQELIETRYEIECPRCGYRVQVERSTPTSNS
jgi:hypothetical protein